MRVPLAAALLLGLGACVATTPSASPAPSADVVTVAKPLGSRQCEAGAPDPATVLAPLREAGIPLQAVGCGDDGRMRAAVCGTPDGRLALADVPGDRLADARDLGFRPLSEWPGAHRAGCPPVDGGRTAPGRPAAR